MMTINMMCGWNDDAISQMVSVSSNITLSGNSTSTWLCLIMRALHGQALKKWS